MQSPPWHFVDYKNDSINTTTSTTGGGMAPNRSQVISQVIGGRDYNLLRLLAKKMNFKFKYIDPPERTQGATKLDSTDDNNLTFSGALGMLQRGVRFIYILNSSPNFC